MARPPQVGGNHYGPPGSLQPIDLIEAMNLDFNSGNVIKYVARFRNTHDIRDLEKAQWYLSRLLELNKAEPACTKECDEQHTYEDGCLLATVNATQTAEDAVRQLAGELERLHQGMGEIGILLLPGIPLSEAPVTTALAFMKQCRENH